MEADLAELTNLLEEATKESQELFLKVARVLVFYPGCMSEKSFMDWWIPSSRFIQDGAWTDAALMIEKRVTGHETIILTIRPDKVLVSFNHPGLHPVFGEAVSLPIAILVATVARLAAA